MKVFDRGTFWIACLWLVFVIQWVPASNKPIRGICYEIARSEKIGPEFIQECKSLSEDYERKDLSLLVLGTSVLLVVISYRLRRLSGKSE